MPKIIYNTTYHVQKEVANAWIRFMQEEFEPVIKRSETLSEPRICRLLLQSEGDSFAVQFQAPSRQDIELWIETEGEELHQALRRKFGEKVLFFSTFMEEI